MCFSSMSIAKKSLMVVLREEAWCQLQALLALELPPMNSAGPPASPYSLGNTSDRTELE